MNYIEFKHEYERDEENIQCCDFCSQYFIIGMRDYKRTNNNEVACEDCYDKVKGELK